MPSALRSTVIPSAGEDGVQLVLAERSGRYGRLELAVDHAVGPVRHDRELVGDARVDARGVAPVGSQLHAEVREELVVRDVLDLRADDAPGDLELLLVGQAGAGEARHDPVVLAEEERVDRGEGDVLVGPNVSGDDCLLRSCGEGAHQVHRRGRRCVPAGRCARQIAARCRQQRRGIVGRVAVGGAVTQPVEPTVRHPVDVGRVDEAAERVDLLPGRAAARSRGRGSPGEGKNGRVVAEVLEPVLLVEGHVRRFCRRFVPQADVVVEELPPGPTPL